MTSFKDHPVYQATMKCSWGLGLKGFAIILSGFFDTLPPEKQKELLQAIEAMKAEESKAA